MPSGTSGSHGKARFSDGEGLVAGDVNDLSHLLDARRLMNGRHNGRGMSRAQNPNTMRHGSSQGMSLQSFGVAGGSGGLATTALYVPEALDGLIRPQAVSAAVALGDLFVENAVIVYRENANMGGTAPNQIGEVIECALEDEDHDLGADITGNAAPGAGNPRWDTLGVRLNYEATDSQTRDFKDAVTGALSTQSQDKIEKFFTDYQFTVGAQSATYAPSAFATAGMVPIVTIARPAGETAPLNPDNFYYHPYPMRFGVEDVIGYELLEDGAGAEWIQDTLGLGAKEKSGAGAGTLYAIPRTLHAGCRLIGVAVITDATVAAHAVDIGRWRHAVGGAPAFTSIVDVSSGTGIGPIDTTVGGFQAAGEFDWSQAATFNLPIWGNGLSRGPLFNLDVNALTTATAYDRLAVRIQQGGSNWANAERVYGVRFFYLY